ncbi:MAG: endonuclease/exonuclease/phosphatase family protein [Balneolaceae bacterium]|nr:endonuclease/exonuclease/phosphatase family protein [Balneolaceae bacterium]
MKKSITLLQYLFILVMAALFTVTGCEKSENFETSNATSSAIEPIRVMSFNIRYDNPEDGPDAWPNRKDFVASTIQFHKSDIIGIQEGLVHQLHDLDGFLGEFDRVGVGRDDGKEAGEFSAIYYKANRFEPIKTETFWLSETPDVTGSKSWDAAITRIVTWAYFRDNVNNENFYLFNTHFDHRGVEARINSAKLIVEKIEEIAGDEPVVLTGDFNTTDDREPYSILTETDREGSDLVLYDGFYHSENGHHGPTSTSNGFEEIRPDRRIDYIFVNDGFKVTYHGILADVRDGHFPSDHLPVLAEIVLSQP